MWIKIGEEGNVTPNIQSVEKWLNTDSIDSMKITYSPEEESSGHVILRLALRVGEIIHHVGDPETIHEIIAATLSKPE